MTLNECCCPRTDSILNVNCTTKYIYFQSQYSRTWDSKCLALIAQLVRAFSMNPKFWGCSPHQVETFPVSERKLGHLHKNISSWVKYEFCCQCTVSNVDFTTKIYVAMRFWLTHFYYILVWWLLEYWYFIYHHHIIIIIIIIIIVIIIIMNCKYEPLAIVYG